MNPTLVTIPDIGEYWAHKDTNVNINKYTNIGNKKPTLLPAHNKKYWLKKMFHLLFPHIPLIYLWIWCLGIPLTDKIQKGSYQKS